MMFARPRFWSVLFSLVAVMAALGATPAAAAPPTSASGTFGNSGDPSSCRPAGGNTICEFGATIVSYTGTFNGSSTGTNTLIFHPDGTANFHGFFTFTGTVNGMPGTVTFAVNGGATSSLQYRATLVSVSGTGGLANLHAVLNEVGTVGQLGPLGTYTGRLSFDGP